MKRVGQRTVVLSLKFMNVKGFHLLTLLLLSTTAGWSVPQSAPSSRPSQGENSSTVIRQLKTGLADLKNDVKNHESEIRIFEEKLYNQESSFDQLRQQLIDDVQSQRDFARASKINLDGKTETLDQSIKNLEMMTRGFIADLRQMKTQANDSVIVLGQYKQKLTELERLLDTQNQHMQNLEAALHSMMEVLQAKETAKEIGAKESEGPKTYKVQSGDTLEKIARTQKVTVQSLRDANQLSNDRIIVGQKIKIP